MEAMDRRNLLQGLLFSAVATGLGTSVFLTTAKAAPIPLQKDLANKLEPLTENAQVVVARPAATQGPSPPASIVATSSPCVLVAPWSPRLRLALMV
jgi:hypothetical protein